MKVAIIGAGVSGLACAHEFELLGIKADIYERKDKVGEIFPHVGAIMALFNRPTKDQLQHLKQNYKIAISPLEKLNSIKMHSPNTSSETKGDLGYLVLRGQDDASIENQLATSLTTKINFNSSADVQTLAKDYDAVIVATGNHEIAETYGIWSNLVETWVRGAIVLGEFQPGQAEMWVNTDYAKQGYGYLMPFNKQRAALTLVITDVQQNKAEDYWHLFWQTEKFDYKIVQVFELPYKAGYVFPQQIDNIYFVGNAGGFLEPLLGFGIFQGIISGVTAARCIVSGKDYQEEIQPLVEDVIQMLEFRKAINSFSNKDYDKLLKFLGMPGISKIIYNTNLDIIKYSSSALGAVSKIAMKKLFS